MNVSMFTSWNVRCGIADYAAQLVPALDALPDTRMRMVPFDRRPHPRADWERWGAEMNAGDVAHIQHEYSFFGYLLPWRNAYGAFTTPIRAPLVITRHVTFDGPLLVPGRGPGHWVRQLKWRLYQTGPYARHLNRDTFDIARRIIVLSARLKDHLARRGVSGDKIHVIPAGVPAVARAERDDARRAVWGWAGKTVICHFGFIAPPKGHLLALDALARLPDDYVYLIAGGARLDAHQAFVREVERRIDALGLRDRVRITGFLDERDIAPTLSAADVLIYPNTHADFSYSVVVGLAHRASPVLASDIAGHREIAGYCPGLSLFRAGDAAALAAQITALTTDHDRARAAIAAMARYAEEWSWQAVARRTREVYALALDSRVGR